MSTARLKGHPNSSFTYAGVSYDADEDGFIEVPVGEAVTHAFSHQFKQTTEKPVARPLAKAAKGGADDTPGDGTDKVTDGEPTDAEKPVKKGAKAAKGGAE
jgi:hypothetical protein